jgi:hypothetical protein
MKEAATGTAKSQLQHQAQVKTLVKISGKNEGVEPTKFSPDFPQMLEYDAHRSSATI